MINHRLKKAFLAVATQALLNIAYAQSSARNLSMDEAVSIALEQNKGLSIAAIDEKIAMAHYRETDAAFLPGIGVSYSALSTNNPLNAFGFKLQQKSVSQQDFDPSILNHPGAVPDFSLQAGIQQPLLNLDMLYMRKASYKQAQVQHMQGLRKEDHVVLQVKQTYLQLFLAQESLHVLQEALSAAKATYKFISDRYEQGLLQKYDLLNSGVQVKTIETAIAEATSNIHNLSDALSLLMNQPAGIVYVANIPGQILEKMPGDMLPPKRADLLAMETAVQSYDWMIKSSRARHLPQLNAFANYQLHDKSIFGFGGSGYLAGIQLSWNIFSGFQTKYKIAAQTEMRKKIIAEREEQKSKSNHEIAKTIRTLNDAEFNIRQQREAVEESAEALRTIRNRFNQGLVNTAEVLMAQAQLAQQKMGLAQAEFTQYNAVIYLQFLTTVHQP